MKFLVLYFLVWVLVTTLVYKAAIYLDMGRGWVLLPVLVGFGSLFLVKWDKVFKK